MEMLRSQSMAHIALVLQTIFNEHTTGLSRITFAGWRDILAALKAQNEHDALRKQMSAAQAKADLYKERALQAMMSSGDEITIRLVVCEWCRVVTAARHEKHIGGLQASNDELRRRNNYTFGRL